MASHDSHKQLTTIADSLLDVGKRLAKAGAVEAEEIARLSRALQVEITFLVPTEPLSPQDAIMQRWFAECCAPSGRYATSDEDARLALELWLKENSLTLPEVEKPYGMAWGTPELSEWGSVHWGMGTWIHANYPPTSTGISNGSIAFPFALNHEVKRQVAEHRAHEEAEEQRRQKLSDDRVAKNTRILTPWFANYRKTLPDRIERVVVSADAIKALKGEKLKFVVINKLMRSAGYGFDSPTRKFWERKENDK